MMYFATLTDETTLLPSGNLYRNRNSTKSRLRIMSSHRKK